MAEEKKEYEWIIIAREEVTTYPEIAKPVVEIQTTYVGEGLAPATVHMPKDEWSQEKEDEMIARDIHERLKIKPETRRAPIPKE